MQIQALRDNGIFAYIPDLEPIWGTLRLLMGPHTQTLCAEIYGQEQVASWTRKYQFLFETFQTMAQTPALCMMDFILDLELEGLTLERFRDAVLALPPQEFLWRQLDLEHHPDAHPSVVEQALTDEDALDQMYGWVAQRGIPFLAFSAFCRQSRRFITQFFALAQELRTPALEQVLHRQDPQIQQLYQTICDGAKEGDYLSLSQTLMGKTFRNRGPYQQFLFLPSYLLPVKVCRYFHMSGGQKRQLLFLSTREVQRSREDTIKALKAMADPTRYQILTILAQKGPLRGLDLAKEVSLAASTVSHHMEQMKECGLVTEEPVKNSKYYGLNKAAAQALLEGIAKDLSTEPTP